MNRKTSGVIDWLFAPVEILFAVVVVGIWYAIATLEDLNMLGIRKLLRKTLCMDFTLDWCGGRDWTRLTPDWLPSLGCFAECCRDHDWLYEQGGDEDDRKCADWNLFECMRLRVEARAKTCWGKIPGQKKRGKKACWTYFHAVRKYGASHFNYHK